MSFNNKFKSSNSHTKASKRLFVWIKQNILLILAPALLTASGQFFYDLGRLVSHTVFSGPSAFLNVAIPFERNIQLNNADSWLVIPYFLAYLYWIVTPFIINCVLGKQAFYRFFAASLVANIIGFFIWAFLPTKQDPGVYQQACSYVFGDAWVNNGVFDPQIAKVNNHGFIGSLLGMIYNGDCPDNLSPSNHNNMTFLVFLIFLFPSHKTNKRHWGWISFTGIFYAFIGCATIFIRQHALIDIVTGIGITACAAMFIGDHAKLGVGLTKVFDAFDAQLSSSFIRVKTHRGYKITFGAWCLLWIIVVGFGIYWDAIKLLTGDPFQSIWNTGVWEPHQYMV